MLGITGVVAAGPERSQGRSRTQERRQRLLVHVAAEGLRCHARLVGRLAIGFPGVAGDLAALVFERQGGQGQNDQTEHPLHAILLVCAEWPIRHVR